MIQSSQNDPKWDFKEQSRDILVLCVLLSQFHFTLQKEGDH